MARQLKIVFMGTPEFAVPSLAAIVEAGFDVVGVITAPDKPKGRGKQLATSAVKDYATANDLPLFQPTNLKDPAFQEELRATGVNLQVVVAFRMLPESVWGLPEYGTFNLHASLLPDYRGAAPINWAIINGETKTGLTTFFLEKEIDTGELLLQAEEPITTSDTAGTLHDRLMAKGADLVLQTVRLVAQGQPDTRPQPAPSPGKEAPKLFKENCQLDWTQPCETLHNQVRGLSPYPAAWTTLGGDTYKIFATEVAGPLPHHSPGEWQTNGRDELRVACGQGSLRIVELQKQGKKRMNITEFLRGNQL